MEKYRDLVLELVLQFDFRFGVDRKYLEDVLLSRREPPLELWESPDPHDANVFYARDPRTRVQTDLNDILLPFLAGHLATTTGLSLDDIGLDNPTSTDMQSLYGGSDEYPVGNNDGNMAQHMHSDLRKGYSRADTTHYRTQTVPAYNYPEASAREPGHILDYY